MNSSESDIKLKFLIFCEEIYNGEDGETLIKSPLININIQFIPIQIDYSVVLGMSFRDKGDYLVQFVMESPDHQILFDRSTTIKIDYIDGEYVEWENPTCVIGFQVKDTIISTPGEYFLRAYDGNGVLLGEQSINIILVGEQ